MVEISNNGFIVLNGTQILAQTTNGVRTDFRYDGNGKLIAIRYNGIEYYYVTNILGDITGLIDSTGSSVVEYYYDVWGKILHSTGTLATTLGVANPFLYRGYYFDTESGFYYLQSRYYDPMTGRFINADDTSILQEAKNELLSANQFAYCSNNPVNMQDTDGHFGTPISWAMAIIGAIAGWFFGDYVARKLGITSGWKYWAIRTGIVIGGAVIGWFAGEALVFVAKAFLLGNPLVLAKMPIAVLWLLGIGCGGTIVIGETMARVQQYASGISAQVYSGLYNYSQIATRFGTTIANFLGKVDNAKWLLDKMLRGYKVVDIGIDLERASRSSSYLMERILTFFYQNKEIVKKIVK